jgi:hypothetical protein
LRGAASARSARVVLAGGAAKIAALVWRFLVGRWCSPNSKRLLGALTLGLLGFFVTGCGEGQPGGVAGDPGRKGVDTSDRCATPNTGCACDVPKRVVDCGTVQQQAAGQTWCSVGHRVCGSEGAWGECEVEELRLLPATSGEQAPQALGTANACLDKPCDPFCQRVTDTGSDLGLLPMGLQEAPGGGITLVAREGNINETTCTSIELTPPEQTLTATSIPGGSPGLLGEYFNQTFGNGPITTNAVVTGTRLDPEINFDWQTVPGVKGVGENSFSVRWTGWLRPQVARPYTLCALSDDGSRIWLDNVLVVDNWGDHASHEVCAAVPSTLLANKHYRIRVEYYEASGGCAVKLRWKHPDAPSGEIVPSTVLLPPGGEDLPTTIDVTPPYAQFAITAQPPGCFEGAIRAAWTIDKLDRSRVDNAGRVTLLAPIAGDVEVSAHAGKFSASATVHVAVDAVDTREAPAGAVDEFIGSSDLPDTLTFLYPYEDTVFPLGLRAPTIQWDNANAPGDAVKVTVRAPFADSTFVWGKILPDVTPGRYTIPQNIWQQLEASAKGGTAGIMVERVVAGTLRRGLSRRIRFANAPVRGKIYYTQYGRNGSTNMMVAEPGSPTFAKPVFPTDTGGVGETGNNGRKCPVCHSVSANGMMFATADRSYGSNGGLSKINPDGSFSLLSDYTAAATPYRDDADDWRGFAWAALTPDGKFALAANNIWGNSAEELIGIDKATRTVTMPTTVISGGSGIGLLAKYFMNTTASGWDFRRFDPRVNFNWGSGSPGGPVPASFSTLWSGQVQGYTNETYTFRVTTTGGVRLTVGGVDIIDQLAHNSAAPEQLTGTAPLTRGGKTAILLEFRDNAANASIDLGWSSASLAYGLIPQTQLYPNDGQHGLVTTFYDNDDFTAEFLSERLESNIDANWGSGGPRPMASQSDDWSAIYRGRLQAPTAGRMQVCAEADDGLEVRVDNVQRIETTEVTDECSELFTVTEGALYPLEVRFQEEGGDALLRLSWRMETAGGAQIFARDIIPSARLFPPAAWTPPTHGLTATYYDTGDFNAAVGPNSPTLATTRIETSAELSWAAGRPENSSALTSNDEFSGRLTGRVEAPCAGLYEFEVNAEGGGRLWIDDERIIHLWGNGTRQGAKWLSAGMHSFKLDVREDTGDAKVSVRWKMACNNTAAFTPIPSDNLYPTGDSGTAGFVLNGGDNQTDRAYFVWETPTAAGNPATNVSTSHAGRWGLGSATMMVPSFAPDTTKLVFIDGDSAGGNGWRKGLSTFQFDYQAREFKNRKTVVSTWPFGDVMKWPVFESDSRSVIYQATVPADACCRKTNPEWTKYGYMGPSNYFEDPGSLYSVDTEAASPTPVALTRLNSGERVMDRNKAYQPTMLPQASAGYRWAVFTSTRPYGNTLNLAGQQDFSNASSYTYISQYENIQSMLWVSAIDDQPSGAADRSHPAFFLPNQSFSETPSHGFLNERAYWVAEACRPTGVDADSSCDVDEDCCGGTTGEAVCRIDAPLTYPPTRHCFKVPRANECVMNGQACVSSDECCSDNVCDEGICAKPPPLIRFNAANYERIYESNCGPGKQANWTFFEYKASVPEVGGALEFYAESADKMADFHALAVSPAAVDTPGVVLLGSEAPPGDLTKYRTLPMDAPFKNANAADRKLLKITVRFVPNNGGTASPVLSDWRLSFSCVPAE